MAVAADAIIGVDLGTSSIKVTALSLTGDVVGRARRGYATHRESAGAAEQHPGDWVSALVGALKELATKVAPQSWAAMGLSGMLPTLVMLDRENQPVGSAVTWEDARAEADATAYRFRHEPGLYERTGQRIDGRYLLPMFERVRRMQPHDAHRTVTVAGAKDYIFLVLTGVLATDPSTATGFGCFDLTSGGWTPAVAELPGVPEIAPSESVRPLSAGFAQVVGARAGIPVVLGAADSVLGAYGLGARVPGQVAYIAGTSTVIIAPTETFTPDSEGRYLVTPLAQGGFGEEMDLLATGSALQWLAGLVKLDGAAAVMSAATTVEPGDAPTFLPYLAPGEQGALWSTGLRGAIFGLTLGSNSAEIARGLLNGIILESRRCTRILASPSDGRSPNLLVSGSSATSPPFRQDLADATGLVVQTARGGETDHSAIGAAAFAGRACGFGEIAHRIEWEETMPDLEKASLWDFLEAQHESHRLSLPTDGVQK